MKRNLGIIAISLLVSVFVTDRACAQSSSLSSPVAHSVSETEDLSFSQFDSIMQHASVLYASKVLNESGFKLAYGQQVREKEWKGYNLNELAFAKSATYNEDKQAWKTSKGVPYSYIRLVYDGEGQQLCHYQIKFSSRNGFSLFHVDALKNGYLHKSKKEDNKQGVVSSVYYRKADNSYIVFSEYADGMLFIDSWKK